jgi:hypothetical protein
MRVGEGRMSARPSSPVAGDGDTVGEGRRVGEEQRVEEGCASWRGVSGTGAARRGGGDDDGGREARGDDLGEND